MIRTDPILKLWLESGSNLETKMLVKQPWANISPNMMLRGWKMKWDFYNLSYSAAPKCPEFFRTPEAVAKPNKRANVWRFRRVEKKREMWDSVSNRAVRPSSTLPPFQQDSPILKNHCNPINQLEMTQELKEEMSWSPETRKQKNSSKVNHLFQLSVQMHQDGPQQGDSEPSESKLNLLCVLSPIQSTSLHRQDH